MSSSLTLHNNGPFLYWIVTYKEKWILHDQWWPAQWLDWEEAPKHFPKPNLYQKIHGHCWGSAAGLIHYSFLNTGKTTTSKYAQQIDETQRKLPTPAGSTGQQKGPSPPPRVATLNHTLHNQHLKSWQIGLPSFAPSAIFIWPPPLLQASQQSSAGKTLPQPAGGRRCSPRAPQVPKHGFLRCRNKQTGTNVLTVMVSILVKNDVFEPSYNHLKFSPKSQLLLYLPNRRYIYIYM